MQIALQTKIKRFYRPTALVPAQNMVWQEQLCFTRTTAGYRFEKPTPYFITVIDLTEKGRPASDDRAEIVEKCALGCTAKAGADLHQ